MFQQNEGVVDHQRNESGSGRGVQSLSRERGEGRLKRLPGIYWRDRGQSLKCPTVYRSSLKSGVAGITRRRYMASVRRVYLLVQPLEKGESERASRIDRPETGVYSAPDMFLHRRIGIKHPIVAPVQFLHEKPRKSPGLFMFNSPAKRNRIEIAVSSVNQYTT